jgi:hypothetical protein
MNCFTSVPSPSCCLSRCLAGRLRHAVFVTACASLTLAGGAFGQDDDARSRFSAWSKVETATETRSYKEAMRSGAAFDAKPREFLEQIALPQLELEANRPTIERVRKRLREFLLADIANEKAAEEAGKTFLAFMESLAGKDDADPVVRVNAMLLIGELQSADRKPSPAAATVLVTSLSKAALPAAVRIAACVGLARHVEATKGLPEEQKRMADLATPAILSILKQAATPETEVENTWLASRCVSMLPLLGPMSPTTAVEVVRIIGDDSRAINLRVRAAAALAAAAGPDSKIEKAAVIQSIGELAVTSLDRDVAAADRIKLARAYGITDGQPIPGGGPPGGFGSPDGYAPPGGFGMQGGFGPPGGFGMQGDPSDQPLTEQFIPREVCRRAAWRLAVLADAILTDDSKRGLAILGGAPSPADPELAKSLRRAAMDLDATPEEATLRQAVTELKRELKPSAPAAADNTPEPAATAPPTPTKPPAPTKPPVPAGTTK